MYVVKALVYLIIFAVRAVMAYVIHSTKIIAIAPRIVNDKSQLFLSLL